ncbi:MAG: nucleotidyltransferase family protein [Planctomycetes bacterium]|nr:nucleotidyltransferase family protein [Planctomycetota bacterium]
MSGIVPIVLAAGRSTRMGQPKVLLDFDGRTCLERVVDEVRGYEEPIVVMGYDGDRLLYRLKLEGVHFMYNMIPVSSPLDSLRAALQILPLEAEAFFFMPVDNPLVFAADIRRLVDAYRANTDPGKSIFVPSHDMKRGHPILCRRELAAEFLDLKEGTTPRDVLNRVNSRVAYVIYPEAYVLMDMDTPEDYRRCLEAYRARKARST